MNALIVVDGKHGGTLGIATALQRGLASDGIDARVARPGEAPDPASFDLVILGSAVYVGRWMASMKDFVAEHEHTLRARPVYVFSSGPLGDAKEATEDIPDARAVVERTAARGHVVFAGKLDKAELSLAERAIVRMVKAPYGDHRPWADIAAWAARIAREARPREAAP